VIIIASCYRYRLSTRINARGWILLQRKSAGENVGRKEGYYFGLITARACS
jgi:hypothetical protein